MIKISLKLVMLLVGLSVFAQQDPEAKKILDRVAAKSKEQSTIQAEFEFTITNRPEGKTSSSTGLIKMRGEMYYMESMGTKVYFDGTSIWSYLEDVNEVTISEAEEGDEDIMENPSKIFEFYNRDYKYKLVGEAMLDAGWTYEIDLFPNNLEQAYSRFKILVLRDSDEIYMIKAVGKDGVDYSAHFRNYIYNENLSSDYFTFDVSKHKGVEVIDLRF